MKFYFTYGTAKQYPYYGGWTEVTASSRERAVMLFRLIHPDVNPGIVNCAEIYSEESFKKTEMYKNKSNFGNNCMEEIEG